MDALGYKPVFDTARGKDKLDFEDFRNDPAYSFVAPAGNQVFTPDIQALTIAAEQDIDLFLHYLKIPKPALGYKNLNFYPADAVDCRHIMMSTIIFSALKTVGHVVEIGGGFGNWARINVPTHPINRWTIIDLDFVQELQKWYLEKSLSAEDHAKIAYVKNTEDFSEIKPDLVIGAHSLNELAWTDFETYLPLLNRTEYLFYASPLRSCNAEISNLFKIKLGVLLTKFDVVKEVQSEQGYVTNILFRAKRGICENFSIW